MNFLLLIKLAILGPAIESLSPPSQHFKMITKERDKKKKTEVKLIKSIITNVH